MRCAQDTSAAGKAPAGSKATPGLHLVVRPDVTAEPGSDVDVALRLATAHGVPTAQRFQLLCRVRAARCAATPEGRVAHAARRLTAVFSLLHMHASEHDRLEALVATDPELVPDLFAIAARPAAPAPGGAPPGLRTQALKCVTAAVRARLMTAIGELAAPRNRRLLPSLVHGSVTALLADAGQEHLLPVPPGSAGAVEPPVSGGEASMDGGVDLGFVEAVFSLLAALSGHVSECGLTEAALVAALLPLLTDTQPRHAALVASALRLLEAFMEFQTGADAAFRDGSGVTLLIARLRHEVDPTGVWGAPHGVPPLPQDEEMEGPPREGEAAGEGEQPAPPPPPPPPQPPVVYDAAPTPVESADAVAASHSSRSVVKGLIRCIGLATLTPRGGGATLGLLLERGTLAPCLVALYRQPRTWGHAVFALAMSLLADIIHSNPTAYPLLHTAGAPTALVGALMSSGVPSSSDAVVTVPTVLGAVCLHPAGLAQLLPPPGQEDTGLGVLQCLHTLLVSKEHVRVMQHGDTTGILASGLDELMRHVPRLRAPCMRMLLSALRTLAVAAGAQATGQLPQAAQPEAGASSDEAMDTDGEAPPAPAAASGDDSQAWVCDALTNVARLLEGVLHNGEACRLFVDSGGMAALLAAVSAPAVMAQFSASSAWQATSTAVVALQSVFRLFGAQHMPQLATCLREALAHALAQARDQGAAPHPGRDSAAAGPAAAVQLPPPYRRWLAACESLFNVAMTTIRSNSASLLTHGFLGAEGSTEGGDHDGCALLALAQSVERQVAWKAALAEEARARWLDASMQPGGGSDQARVVLAVVDQQRAALAASGLAAGEAQAADMQAALCVYLTSVKSLTPDTAPPVAAEQPGGAPVAAPVPAPALDRAELCSSTAHILAKTLLPGPTPADGDAVSPQLEEARAQAAAALEPLLSSCVAAAASAACAAEVASTLSRFEAASRAFLSSVNKVIATWHRLRGSAPVALARSVAWSMATDLVAGLTTRMDAALPTGGMLFPTPLDADAMRTLSQGARLRCVARGLDALGGALFDAKSRGSRLANPLLLNYIVAAGGADAVAAAVMEAHDAFVAQGGEANPPPAQAMPTPADDALCCGGAVLEALCNVPFLLSGAASADLLTAAPPAGASPAAARPLATVDALSRCLHAAALRVLLPIWRHPRRQQAPARFVQAMLVALAHVARGIAPTPPSGGPGDAENAPPVNAQHAALVARFVEMGFPAGRVEEALRRVRPPSSNAVFEWLVTHPEPEQPVGADAPGPSSGEGAAAAEAAGTDVTDPDVAAALALSLTGPQAGPSAPAAMDEAAAAAELFEPQELLNGAVALISAHPGSVHAAVDLLVASLRRIDAAPAGGRRSALMRALAARMQTVGSANGDLAGLAHVALLLLTEDPESRSDARREGLPAVLLSLLQSLTMAGQSRGVVLPRWVSAVVLTLDVLAQWRPAGSDGEAAPPPDAAQPPGQDSESRLNSLLGRMTGHLSGEEQAQAVALCLALLRCASSLPPQPPGLDGDSPASVCQAVLQLACRLTKTHRLALAFHSGGGTDLVLHLPPPCLFPGFDVLGAALLRHILEDGQTLKCAMEAEIRGAFASPSLVRPGGRVSPRTLLQHLAHVMGRDPATFCDALAAVTTVDDSAGRVMLVLAAKESHPQQLPPADAHGAAAAAEPPGTAAAAATPPPVAVKNKPVVKVASSFGAVIDALISLVVAYPPADADAAMAVDPPQKGQQATPLPGDLAAGRAGFALRCLTDCLLLYHPTSAVLLRRDTEAHAQGAPRPLLAHVLHALLPAREAHPAEGGPTDAVCRVSDRAVFLLLALCVRSSEGRRRVIAGVAAQLHAAQVDRGRASAPGVVVLVDLVNSLVAKRSDAAQPWRPLAPPSGQQAQPASGISADIGRAMRDAHMAAALAAALRQVDLDHPAAPAVVAAILRPLEALTRAGAGVAAPGPVPVSGSAPVARPPLAAEAEPPTGAGALPLGSPQPQPRPRAVAETPTPTRRPVVAATPGTVGLETAPLEAQVAAVSEMAASLFHNESRRRRRAVPPPGRRPSASAMALAEGEDSERLDAHMELGDSDSPSLLSGDGSGSDDDELMLDGDEEDDEEDDEEEPGEGDPLGDGGGDESMSDDEDSDGDEEEDDPLGVHGDGGAAFRRHLARHLASVMGVDGVDAGDAGGPARGDEDEDDGMHSSQPSSLGEGDSDDELGDSDEEADHEDFEEDEEDEEGGDDDDAVTAFGEAVRAVEDALRHGGEAGPGGHLHGEEEDIVVDDLSGEDDSGDEDGGHPFMVHSPGGDGDGDGAAFVVPEDEQVATHMRGLMRHVRRHLGAVAGDEDGDGEEGLEDEDEAAPSEDGDLPPGRGWQAAMRDVMERHQPRVGGEAIEIRWRDAQGRVGSTAALVPPQLRLGQPGGLPMHLLQSLVADTARTVPPGSAAFAHAFQDIVESVMNAGALGGGGGRRGGQGGMSVRRFGDVFNPGAFGEFAGLGRGAEDAGRGAAPPGGMPRHPLMQRSGGAASAASALFAQPPLPPGDAVAAVLAGVAGDVARLVAAPDGDQALDAWAQVPSVLEPTAAVTSASVAHAPGGGGSSDPLAPLFGPPVADSHGGGAGGPASTSAGWRVHQALSRLTAGDPLGGAALPFMHGAGEEAGHGGVSDPRRALWGDEAVGGASPAMLAVTRLEEEAVARVRAAHPPAPLPPPPPPPPAAEPAAEAPPGATPSVEAPPAAEAPPLAEAAPVPADVVMADVPPRPVDGGAAAEGVPPEAGVEATPMAVSEPAAGDEEHEPAAGDDEEESEEDVEEEPSAEEGDGIDPSFLEALPPDLRAEVLAQQAVAAAQRTAHRAAQRAAQQAARALARQAAARAAAAPGDVPAASAPGGPDAEAIDPEFLAALPPELAAEVLAQQLAAARQRQADAAVPPGGDRPGGQGAGPGGADLDFASLLASFPPDVREEALIAAEEAQIASLPPAQQAEAALLRERAQRRGMVPGAPPREVRRPGPARMPAGTAARVVPPPGGATVPVVPKDVEGDPLLDESALDGLVRLLRLAPPLPRGLMSRLLLHLCHHAGMRTALLARILSLARDDPPPADGGPVRRSMFGSNAASGAAACREVPTTDGAWPPLLVHRALDLAVYLARHHSRVAQLLTRLSVPPCEGSAAAATAAKGKSKAGGPRREDVPALVLLLHIMAQPARGRRNEYVLPALHLLEAVFRDSAPLPPLDAPPQAAAAAAAAAAAPEGGDAAGSMPPPPPPAAQPVPEPVPAAAPAVEGGAGGEAAPAAAPGAAAQPAGDVAERHAREQAAREAARAGIADTLSWAHLTPLLALLVHAEVATPEAQKALSVISLLPQVHPACVPGVQATLTQQAGAVAQQVVAALQVMATTAAPPGPTHATALVPPGAEELLHAAPALLRVVRAVLSLQKKPQPASAEPAAGSEEASTPAPVSPPGEVLFAVAPVWGALEASAGALEALVAPTGGVEGQPQGGAPPEERPSLPDAVTAVQPLLEAWLALTPDGEAGPPPAPLAPGSQGGPSQAGPAVVAAEQPTGSSSSPMSPCAAALWHFIERHRRLINALVRAQPQLVAPTGGFKRLLHAPRLLDFDNKRSLLRLRLRALAAQERAPSLRLVVRRAHVLTDSYQQLHLRTPGEMRGRLSVQFHGEEGVDAGGLSREWYSILARAMFDPSFALFVPSVGGDSTFQPNKDSAINPEHLSYFTLCGRVVGKALLDGQLLDAYFTRSFYKHMLRQPVLVEDIEAIDPEYYTALRWMLENDISGVLDLTFVAEEEYFGARTTVELKPGGAGCPVTEENKREYVQLITAHRMTGAIKQQTDAFTRGFNDLVPHTLVAMFNAQELELLISGLPEIDVDDLHAHTEYHGFSATSPVVAWFWAVVRSLTKEDLARLLMFVTGSSKVPLGGFAALQGISGPQKFQIHKAYGGGARLCTAHTCFNQLDLPEYSSADELRERLMLAIHEGNEGFGFA